MASRPIPYEDYPAYLQPFTSFEELQQYATHGPFEKLTDDEVFYTRRWAVNAKELTYAMVNDIISLYCRVVGDENPKEIERRITNVGFFDYSDAVDKDGLRIAVFNSEQLMSTDPKIVRDEWRLGSKAWPHTKLRFRTIPDAAVSQREYVNFYLDPNGIGYRGYSAREKIMVLEFADMLRAYLEWQGKLIDLEQVEVQ